MSTANPLASISAQQVDVTKAPAPVTDYLCADDQIYIRSICSVASVVLRATARFMRSDGLVVIDSFRHVPNSNRTAALTFHRSIEGYLLSLSVTVEAGTVRRGQCFVQVGVARGTSTNPEFGQLLVSDYATASGELGYPYSLLRSSLDGPGFIQHVTVSNPAAGANFLQAVPTGARWALRSLCGTLVTSAAVANRIVQLVLEGPGSQRHSRHPQTTAQTATQTVEYTWAQGAAQLATVNSAAQAPLLSNHLQFAGARIASLVTLIDVGDQWGTITALTEEWLEL